jgi:hypothetical protein
MEEDETKGDWIFHNVVEHIDTLNKMAGAEVVVHHSDLQSAAYGMLFLDDSRRDLNSDLIFLQLFPLSVPFVLYSTVWTDLPDGL